MYTHEQYMQRCLQLAENAIGNVAPNPLVGCVIVYDGKIIGEGYHQKFGGAHAEVNAINAVQDKNLLSKSTLYVNLEPCSHFGKTPPCVDLILKHRIPEVVIGMQDPFAQVNGAGIEKLEMEGVQVTVGVLEKECKNINKRFITFHSKKRPYIILKWAQSADGFIGKKNERVQISNDYTKVVTHRWRSEQQAILIGSNTALIDDPQLTVREWSGPSPIRLVVDRAGKLSENLKIFDGSQRTIIFTCSAKHEYINAEKIIIDNNNQFFENLVNKLYSLGIQSVLVEGGATLLQLFIDQNTWDEAYVFTAPQQLINGVKAPAFPYVPVSTQKIGDNFFHLYQSF